MKLLEEIFSGGTVRNCMFLLPLYLILVSGMKLQEIIFTMYVVWVRPSLSINFTETAHLHDVDPPSLPLLHVLDHNLHQSSLHPPHRGDNEDTDGNGWWAVANCWTSGKSDHRNISLWPQIYHAMWEYIVMWMDKKKIFWTQTTLEASYRVQNYLIEFPFSTLRRFLGMTSTNFQGELFSLFLAW